MVIEKIKDQLKVILDLKDGEDGEPASLYCVGLCCTFLSRLLDKVTNLPTPDLNLCRDGSIDMEFKDLLVNVDGNDRIGFYGSCNGSEIRHTKYYDPQNPASDFERLVAWIKINLVDSEL